MKKLIYALFIIFFAVAACKGPEARRPVSAKSGTFMRASVERNKELLAYEEALISRIIEKDSLNTYVSSSNGYWYYYNVKDTTDAYTPEKGDVLTINYDIKNLDGQAIYTSEEIGNIEFVVDKEDYFPGLRTGVKLMKKGEIVTFFFPSVLGYGYHGDKDRIGTNEPIISTVKLIDIKEAPADSIN